MNIKMKQTGSTPIYIQTALNCWAILWLLLITLLILTIPWFLKPNPGLMETHRQLLLPPCPFYQFTKIPCLFCGTTTSFSYITHGNIQKAFLANPAAPILYLFLSVLAIILTSKLLRQKKLEINYTITLQKVLFIAALIWIGKLLVWFLG